MQFHELPAAGRGGASGRGGAAAAVGAGRGRGRGRGGGGGSTICSFCRNPGHTDAVCWKKHHDQAPAGWKWVAFKPRDTVPKAEYEALLALHHMTLSQAHN